MVNVEIETEQFGFRSRKGTRDRYWFVKSNRGERERDVEKGDEEYVAFVDLENTFD